MTASAADVERARAARLERWTADGVAERLWRRDVSLWEASGADPQQIAGALGWLDLADAMRARVDELEGHARSAREDGYEQAAVLGMGGSSLAPELFARVFGSGAADGADRPPGLALRILDSTHPEAVRAFRDWAAQRRTLFLVSSKSGTTLEPLIFHSAMSTIAPARDFIAITDPGTPLEKLALREGFRAVIPGRPDVGGRYSALTSFGLLPAALIGVDLGGLLDRAAGMAQRCREPGPDNPGLELGATIGEAALAGRDKLTVLTSRTLVSFGDWVEQLIAESTGKLGRGIVPVVGETLGGVDRYGPDRNFVVLTLAGEADRAVTDLARRAEADGHPVTRLELRDPLDLGAEFARWEVATAAAGIILGINPFDQPNVQESKDATTKLLDAYRRDGVLPAPAPLVADDQMIAYADPEQLRAAPNDVRGALRALLAVTRPGDYFAVLAYLPDQPAVRSTLERVRTLVRDELRVATTLGFGPRFLHSTGQLHKGGPPSGVFLQITGDPWPDLAIPDRTETFGVCVAAQALGDRESLQRRGRRVLRIHLARPDAGLAALGSVVAEELAALVPA